MHAKIRNALIAAIAFVSLAGNASALPQVLSGTMTTMPSRDRQHTFPVTFIQVTADPAGVGTYRLVYDLTGYSPSLTALICHAQLIRRGDVIAIASQGCQLQPTGQYNPTECNFNLLASGRAAFGKAFCSHYGPAGDNYYHVQLSLDAQPIRR